MNNKQRVLVVDDEKINLKVISDILRSEVEVVLAKNARQGIRKALDYKPDLILMDVVMSDMNGFSAMEVLAKNPLTADIPVIFITGLNNAADEERGLSLGASDYIYKPFNAAIVRARVNLHLQLVRQRKMLEELANIDPLTGIANRRKYQDMLEVEWQAAVRNGSVLSLAIIDIDNFKLYNDHHGHSAGDAVLRRVAVVLADQFKRPRDLVARYGGEEFVLLLPESDCEGALMLAEKCRAAIADLKLPHQGVGNDMHVVTVSTGGVSCNPSPVCNPDRFFGLADDMLYAAKKQGKNRVVWQNECASAG